MERFAIILAGPSGAGKTTVADKLIAEDEIYSMSRSATTRAPRGDGRDGEYIYMTKEEFFEALLAGDILEHTEYSGNMYGTRRAEMDRILSEGKYPVLVLDMNGVESLKKADLSYPVFAFYLYNDLDVIAERLSLRESFSSGRSGLSKRMAVNIDDYKSLPERARIFDRFIENENLDECALKVRATLKALLSGSADYSSESALIASKLKENAEKYEVKNRG